MIKISFLNKSKWFEYLNLFEMQKVKGGDPQTNNEKAYPPNDNDDPIIL